MGALNHFMLGTEKIMTSAMLAKDDPNLSDGEVRGYIMVED